MKLRAAALCFASCFAFCSASCRTAPRAAPSADGAQKRAYSVVTAGRIAGGGEIEIKSSSERREHFTFNDRGRGPNVTTDVTLDESGLLIAARSSGHDYWKAPVDEEVKIENG